MRVVLAVRWVPGATAPNYSEARSWVRVVDRDYSRVPSRGELVAIDDEGLHRAPVATVFWDNSGIAMLSLESSREHDRIGFGEDELEAWGFVAGAVPPGTLKISA